MSDSYIDGDLALVIVTGVVAATYLALAVWNFWHERVGYGVARLLAAVLFGAVAVFIATFQIRLF